MKGVSIVLASELSGKTREELVAIFKQEVEDFSAWMERLPDWKYQGPLTSAERILLATYLIQKYTGHIDALRPEPSQPEAR